MLDLVVTQKTNQGTTGIRVTHRKEPSTPAIMFKGLQYSTPALRERLIISQLLRTRVIQLLSWSVKYQARQPSLRKNIYNSEYHSIDSEVTKV